MLLDSVVGQMDEYIVLLIKVKLVTRHANVALFEEVALVFWGDQHPQSDIELALVDQQWLLYVLLDDKDIGFDDLGSCLRLALNVLCTLIGTAGVLRLLDATEKAIVVDALNNGWISRVISCSVETICMGKHLELS